MSNPSVLLTGASGLIGSYLVPMLCDNGYHVHSINRSLYTTNISDLHTFHDIDLSSTHLSTLPFNSIDYIIHLAQSRHYQTFPDGAEDVFTINSVAVLQLINLALRCNAKKFVYASTGSIYAPSNGLLTETSPIKSPASCDFYSASKISAEYLLSQFSSAIDVVILRPFFVYGMSKHRSMLIPRLFDSIKSRKPIALQAPKGLYFNPLHAFDAAMAICKCLLPGIAGTFNLAGPDAIHLADVCNAFGKYLNTPPLYEYQDTSPPCVVADVNKLSSMIHPPSKSLLDSIDDISLT